MSAYERGQQREVVPLFLAVLLVAGVTLLGLLLSPVPPANHVMFYLLAVVFAASRWGKGPAALCALASVLSYDFFFVPPFEFLTFSSQDSEQFVTFVCFLLVGLLVAHWTSRIRELAHDRIALQEEARAGEILREKERLQEALLASISHDLQTPISSIVGALDGLCDTSIQLDLESRRSLLETAQLETHRLHRLVRNLLDMTRLESGPNLKLTECDFTDLVGTSLSHLEEAMADRQIILEVADHSAFTVDFVLFNQVLINLIDNALKYSPPGSPVSLSCRHEGGQVVIEVADRGPGIPEEYREKVFEKFFRRSDTNTTSGSGLGLAISRGLVEAHGGTLIAQARPGGGTVLVATVPEKSRQHA